MHSREWRPQWHTRSSQFPGDCGQESRVSFRTASTNWYPLYRRAGATDSSGNPRARIRLGAHPFRSTRGRVTSVATLGVATTAITAVLGLNVVNADHRVAQLRNVMGVPTHTAFSTALRTPGHKIVALRNSNDSESARFVIVPDGRGFLLASVLPVLSSKETYQLWGTIGDQTISLGILGRAPHQVTFTMSGSPRPTRLGISVEPAGGSILPSSRMLASDPI